MATANAITFESLNTTLYAAVQTKEADLKNKIEAVGQNPTTVDLLSMQSMMNEWSMALQLNSTMNKEFSDALKGILQKIN